MRKKLLVATLIAVTLLLLFVIGLVWSASEKIERVEVGDYYVSAPALTPTPQPSTPQSPEEVAPTPEISESVNIFVIGTDSRDGENEDLGGGSDVAGMRSDINILVHIPADKSLPVEVLSIPRDSWVQIPSCVLPSGAETKPRETKFNAAFAYGGQTGDVSSAIGCALTTFTSLTEITVDEAVVLDFAGFKSIIDAIGGVEIEIEEDIYSQKAGGLRLTAGTHLLDGTTALQYARARTGQGLGEKGDLGRIERQQKIIRAMAEKIRSIISSPVGAYNLLGELSDYMVLTNNFTNQELLSLVLSLEGREIITQTIPYEDRGDRANVVWTQETTQLWERINSQ